MKTSNKEEEPHFVKRDKFAITAEYKQWFADIKSRLRNSQIKAAIKVNSTLLEFYWSLGRDIVKMKAEQAWGSGVLQQLSFDLRDEFPGMKGLSYTNLRYAAQWFRFYTSDDESICQQLVDDLPSLIFLLLYNTVIRYFAILYEVSSGQVFVFSFFSKAAISNLRLFRQVIPST